MGGEASIFVIALRTTLPLFGQGQAISACLSTWPPSSREMQIVMVGWWGKAKPLF